MRFRAEFFGGVVAYHGASFGGSGPSLLINSHTAYYGGRAEYDLFFRSQKHPRILMFIGLGIRAWNRNISSVTLPGNIFVQGYNETWVTLYPYIGFETPHDYTRVYEFYGRSRVGVTAFTYNYAGDPLATGVYPRPAARPCWKKVSVTATSPSPVGPKFLAGPAAAFKTACCSRSRRC